MTDSLEVAYALAQKSRVLILGGAAVIFHGLNRSTRDIDFWIDPQRWVLAIEELLQTYPVITATYLDDTTGQWESISKGNISYVPTKGRLLRLNGCNKPIDIFYQPNELTIEEFDVIWNRAVPLKNGVRALDIIDLITTKQLTQRPHDETDIAFLESKLEEELCSKLPVESYDYAAAQFQRFRSATTAFSATKNKCEEVRELGLSILNELASNGDPFAQEYLDDVSLLFKKG
ncbi:MAG: hypothetical protein SH807_04295 [Blastochloris sp.]|nr:hypothetical protein [Blastochloris sp.]